MKRDGSVERCPVCQSMLPAPTSVYGETPCPRCEAHLWHLAFPSGPTFFVRRKGESIYDLMAALMDPRHGFGAEDLERILEDADSFDVIELLKEIEDVKP